LIQIITSPGWFFHVIVDGPDLLVRGQIATWFGGDNDPQDDGSTASGINTKGNPTILGCALPVPDWGKCKATAGTPLPNIPWKTPIIVTPYGGSSITVPLIDVGPAESTYHGIDLTQQAFLDAGGNLKDGRLSCDYVIPGGAKFLI